MTTQRCRVIAHRGASRRAPENTLAAFRLARELGADMVELDARHTLDRVVVVHHDAFLADGRAIVAQRAVSLPAHVPTLADALDACAGMHVNVEIKNSPGDPDHDPDDLPVRSLGVGDILHCGDLVFDVRLCDAEDVENLTKSAAKTWDERRDRCGAYHDGQESLFADGDYELKPTNVKKIRAPIAKPRARIPW